MFRIFLLRIVTASLISKFYLRAPMRAVLGIYVVLDLRCCRFARSTALDRAKGGILLMW